MVELTLRHCSGDDGGDREESDVILQEFPSPPGSPHHGGTGSVAVMTINRPRVHNALNMSVVTKILSALRTWQEPGSGVQMLILKGAGDKAFCAGGDIRELSQSGLSGSVMAQDCIITEYTCINTVCDYKIPVVAFIDGITMGAGVGLSIHSTFRVATERTVFSMPETAIGLFPDVSGSYFLTKMLPRPVGLYLALSSERMTGYDMHRYGLATHLVSSHKLSELERELVSLCRQQPGTTSSVDRIRSLLDYYHQQSEVTWQLCSRATGVETLSHREREISQTFSAPTLQGIMSRLEGGGGDIADIAEWKKRQLDILRAMSPTSLVLTMAALRRGSQLQSVRQCLVMEYRLIQRFLDPKVNKDFFEGVRAAVVHKDKRPAWDPPSIAGVSEDTVHLYFSPLPPPLRELAFNLLR